MISSLLPRGALRESCPPFPFLLPVTVYTLMVSAGGCLLLFWLLGKGQVEAKIELEQERVKDVTKKCWQSGQVEEKLDPKTRPALYIQVFTPHQEIVNKNESKRCRISVTSMPRDSQKALSLAIVHLENIKGPVHVIIDESRYLIHGPALHSPS